METVKLGIVGCGVIGQMHATAAAADANIELVALADLDKARANQLADQHGAGIVHDDALALIGDDRVEAVVLAMPTGVRTRFALEALTAGKHLLLEKPGAMNTAEVDQLIEARGDRVIGVASCRFQFLPCFSKIREVIAAGEIGPVRAIRIRGGTPCQGKPNRVPWRLNHAANGGGLLVNWGTYDLDYALACLNWTLKPRTLLARTWPIAEPIRDLVHPDSDAEAHVMAQINCEDGCTIALDRGEFLPVTEDEVQIIGQTGALRQPFRPAAGMRVMIDRISADAPRRTDVLWEGDADWDMLHGGPVRDFAAAIREDREPATNLERWRGIQAIFDAAYRSAETCECESIR